MKVKPDENSTDKHNYAQWNISCWIFLDDWNFTQSRDGPL